MAWGTYRDKGATMKFGIFYEHQLPRPGTRATNNACSTKRSIRCELADKLGIDFAWEVEHHFLEEYSHSSAPEVFLAACSQRTKNIRLGQGSGRSSPVQPPGPHGGSHRDARPGQQWPGGIRHRRVVCGAGAGRLPHSGGREAQIYLEATEQIANMLAMDPYPGFEGQYFSMPCRNIVPKPVQRPHPPSG